MGPDSAEVQRGLHLLKWKLPLDSKWSAIRWMSQSSGLQVQDTAEGLVIRGWYLPLCRWRKALHPSESLEERGVVRKEPGGSQCWGAAVCRVGGAPSGERNRLWPEL